MVTQPVSRKSWGLEVWIGIWIGIIGVLATTVLGLAALWYPQDVRAALAGDIKKHWAQTLRLLMLFIFWLTCIFAIWRTRKLKIVTKKARDSELRITSLMDVNAQLNHEIESVLRTRDEAMSRADAVTQSLAAYRPYPKYDRGRWEKLTNVKYGHLPYRFFLEYHEFTGAPSGLGVELLDQLLDYSIAGKKVDVFPERKPRNWGNIIDGLVKNDYDVVATPLFATFDRSRQVAFTAPLFFSNVGLYVSAEVYKLPCWRNITAEGLASAIKKAGELRFLSVDGEISEKIAKKYAVAPASSLIALDSGTFISSLFAEVKDLSTPKALFCESFYAHLQSEVKSGAVVNVLSQYQILYPVCFAVRLGDYQLANLLNIRLLRFTRNGGALPLLVERLKSKSPDLNPAEIDKHFVAEWPCPANLKEPAHA